MPHQKRFRLVSHAVIARSSKWGDVLTFARHLPGKPAYVSCTRADARYTSRLARGFAPLTPVLPSASFGHCKDQR
jgi:hypothetical protein